MYKSTHSLLLAGVNRRSFLKSSAALGLGAVASPAIVSNALSSSGELSIINWDDELPDPVIPDFEKATGIKVTSTPFSQNEEQINKLQATGGEGFDICQPTHDRALQFKDVGVLQPLDEKKIDLSVIVPGLLAASKSYWTWDGRLYHVPHVWGTEAISWRNDLTSIKPEELSYGTLWNDEYKSKVQGRPHSHAARHRPLARRQRQAAVQTHARRVQGRGQLQEAVRRDPEGRDRPQAVDQAILGFGRQHQVGSDHQWRRHRPDLGRPGDQLKKEGKPVSYQAPKEGAIGWVDGFSLVKGAKNVDQAYEWLKYIHTPEASAKAAENSGYNPSAVGADKLLSDKARAIFNEAYPGKSIDNMWWRPVEPTWFAELRSQYAEKFKAA